MKTWASVFLTKLDHHGLQLYEIKKKHRSTAFFFRTRMVFFLLLSGFKNGLYQGPDLLPRRLDIALAIESYAFTLLLRRQR